MLSSDMGHRSHGLDMFCTRKHNVARIRGRERDGVRRGGGGGGEG